MQNLYKCLLAVLVLITFTVSGQVSPYSLTPAWYFGVGGKMTFSNGNFPTASSPTSLSKEDKLVQFIENSTSISFQDGSVALYTNTMKAYNSDPANTHFSQSMRNFDSESTCSGSSTGGAIAFPDPMSPTNAFYVILSTDMTGGLCENRGINRYRFTGTGTSVAYNAGPTNMDPSAFAGEAIIGCTDGAGGYWVIVHDRTASHNFRVWHFTSSGITGPTDYSGGAAVSNVANNQSYLKMSPCQDKVAYLSSGFLTVNAFDRTTGTIGAELRRHVISPQIHGVGLEFSPDGSKVFFSTDGGQVKYISVGTVSAATDVLNGPSVTGPTTSWSMQLGPDGNIYTSPSQGATQVGVIVDANTNPTFANPLPMVSGTSIYRGLINLVWLTPSTPAITAQTTASSCDVNFSHTFKNYFNTDITPDPSSFVWKSDGTTFSTSATPTHTFPSGGPYNVTLDFQDQVCHHTWSASIPVTVNCVQTCSDGITPAPKDTTICANSSGNITLTASGASTDLQWYDDAGGTNLIGTSTGGSNIIQVAAPASTKEYYVRSIADGSGCNPSPLQSLTVTVRNLLLPSISDINACANSQQTFTLSSAGNDYDWTISSGMTVVSGGDGNNTITVNVGSSNGTISVSESYQTTPICTENATANVTIIPLPDPEIDPSGNLTVCANTQQTFNLSSTGNNYDWSVSGMTIVSGGDGSNFVTVDVGASGGTISVEESAGNSCAQTSDPVVITITAKPSPVITGGTSICADSIANFAVANTSNNFSWSYTTSGNGSVTSALNTNAVTVNMGNAAGKLVVTETNPTDAACFGKDSVDFFLTPLPTDTANAGSDINPCISSNVRLIGNLPSGFTGAWTLASAIGTGTIDTPGNDTTLVDITVAASFAWTITGRCGYQDSDTLIVTHVTSSNLVANTGDQDDTLCDGSTADLRVQGTGGSGDYSYHWFTDRGQDFAVEQDSVLSGVTPPLGTTIYFVEVSDNKAQGCPTAIDSVILYSTNSQELIIPNLVTPNGDEKNDIFELRDNGGHELFPGSTLLVTNRWGDAVYRDSDYDNKWTPSALADGVYYYYLETGCGKKEYKGWVQVVR